VYSTVLTTNAAGEEGAGKSDALLNTGAGQGCQVSSYGAC
jgi:hypothetical protein